MIDLVKAKELGATHLVSGWMLLKNDDQGNWMFWNEDLNKWITIYSGVVYVHERIDYSILEQSSYIGD